MSEIPPDPPQQYASYPRGIPPAGSVEKLRLLAAGYFGLNQVFLINIALSFGMRAVSMSIPNTATTSVILTYLIGLAVVEGAVIALASYPHNKKIAEGAGWGSSVPAIVSALIGLNSAFCCGIIGYIIVQSLASQEMKKYGVKVGFLTTKKKVYESIEQLEANASGGFYGDPTGTN